jgi:hypothetical protein
MMREPSFAYLRGSGLFAAALCTIALSIVDAYFTLDLVSRGAEELNPIMSYYLNFASNRVFESRVFSVFILFHARNFLLTSG